jgi:hypothetical protein
MGGGLMQLVAYGAQDVYLTGNPQITFFKVVYKRHTNFSMESIRQTFNQQLNRVAGRSVATITRNGDLLHKTYLVLSGTTGKISTDYGHNVIDFIEVEIGGQMIDRHYGHFMEAWAELTEPNPTGNRAFITNIQSTSNYFMNNASSTSNISKLPNMFTKFQRMACAGGVSGKDSGNASLVQDIYVPLRFWFCKEPGSALPLIALQYHEVKIIVNFSEALKSSEQELWCDYIYLDTDERRRFAQVSHEYLIEQVQLNSFAIGSGAMTYNLNFNHPVKELIWVIQDSDFWNTTDSIKTFLTLNGDTDIDSPNMSLKLNGHNRFEKRKISYFTNTQTYQYHTGCGVDWQDFTTSSNPVDNLTFTIAVYSFCLKPEEHQPSGTCNFSRIDTSQLITDSTIGSDSGNTFIVYAINYNVLRIMSGMGGLAYSN